MTCLLTIEPHDLSQRGAGNFIPAMCSIFSSVTLKLSKEVSLAISVLGKIKVKGSGQAWAETNGPEMMQNPLENSRNFLSHHGYLIKTLNPDGAME